MSREADIRVLGGLPITVGYTVQPAEPDVGIMSSYVEDYWITHVGGRRVSRAPDWLTRRIDARSGEHERILQDLAEMEWDGGDY